MTNQKHRLIYLASPYTHENKNITEWRVRAVTAATAELINKGYCVFSPIVYTHELAKVMPDSHDTHDNWIAIDKWFMDMCAILGVLTLPGWELSVGIGIEEEYMGKQNKPLLYISPEELGIYSLVGSPPEYRKERTTLWPKI